MCASEREADCDVVVWAEDVASSTELILNKGEINGIYTIGTTQEYSVMDVAKIIVEKMTEEAVYNYIEFVEDRPFNDSRYSVDATLLKSLGWEEKHTNFISNIEKLIQIVSEDTAK